jgi:trehalose 6-phosphate synthase
MRRHTFEPASRVKTLKHRHDAPTPNQRVIVLANRAPFRHDAGPDGHLIVKRSASGLVTALEPLVAMYRGTWIAHGCGTADFAVADRRGGVNVAGGYRLRYVSLNDQEHRDYYYGFANEGVWPLCHRAGVEPVFRARDFRAYQAVNARFAAAVRDEAGGDSPIVLVQDYHLALAPRIIRQQLSSSRVMSFWHIPWPRPRTFSDCPWAPDLLDGLLGSEVIGVQTEEDRLNFLGCAATLPSARVDLMASMVTYRGHSTHLRSYPVGVEWDGPIVRATPPAHACREAVRRQLALRDGVQIGVGVDRLDYTKGIHHKFLAIERLLERREDLRGTFVFVQVAEPSRDCLPAYQGARRDLAAAAERVNSRFGTDTYQPIRLLETHFDPAEVYQLYRAADFCYVGSLHDGMNLVAKEFVAARHDDRGALILSEFAGASQQLRAAIRVNPYHIDRAADAVALALEMSPAEQVMRMRVLRANVEAFDASWWAGQLLDEAMETDRVAFSGMAS